MLTTQKRENVKDQVFVAIHPLDDAPEMKREISNLGPMPMTPVVRRSLIVLRGYLIAMLGLLLYHVIDLAGVLR